MMPADPKLIEATILACLERNPIDLRKVDGAEVKKVRTAIKRATTEKGTGFRYRVTRKHFLCGCLDFTEHLPEEHLIVAYGYQIYKPAMFKWRQTEPVFLRDVEELLRGAYSIRRPYDRVARGAAVRSGTGAAHAAASGSVASFGTEHWVIRCS
jgi:hypothetical protein